MPRLGESVAEGTIGSWLKQEGEMVDKDEALAEVITDKITAELPSPVAGRLTKILVKADETVAVGTDIALIEESADVSATPPAQVTPTPAVAAAASSAATAAAVVESVPVHAGDGSRAASVNGETGQRISPLARRLADEHGINLNQITGTGIGGRIRKEDILAYVASRSTQPQPSPAAVATAPTASTASTSPPPAAVPPAAPAVSQPPPAPAAPKAAPAPTTAGEDEELVTPDRMRMAIAEHMVRTKRTAPHATTFMEVDMTNIARWLDKHKDEFRRKNGYGISYVAFVMKATCEGLRQFPTVNASWTEDNKLLIKKRINLGLAVAIETGLVVPTIYDADQYTLAGLAKQVASMAQRARTNKLTVQDMQGSTFSVNNTGTFGTMFSTPLINQPHAGILSMEAVVKRPMVMEDDSIAIRHMMFLSFTFDHRILDGAGANGFLRAVRLKLQSYGPDIDVY
jgi:pyruvate/2-oxoglutarate dehydrogenase complex dihydrolipoamide acyltransferase (E2) component